MPTLHGERCSWGIKTSSPPGRGVDPSYFKHPNVQACPIQIMGNFALSTVEIDTDFFYGTSQYQQTLCHQLFTRKRNFQSCTASSCGSLFEQKVCNVTSFRSKGGDTASHNMNMFVFHQQGNNYSLLSYSSGMLQASDHEPDDNEQTFFPARRKRRLFVEPR